MSSVVYAVRDPVSNKIKFGFAEDFENRLKDIQCGNPNTLELVYIIPLMMVLVPSVYLIRAKLFNVVRGNDLEEFKRELGVNKTLLQQLKDLFR